MIYWTEFTWEAFATLATGLAAVGGAVFVGLKQAGISRSQTDIAARQTEILAQQVELDDTRLRSELFDKRLQVYDDVEQMILEVLRHANEPSQEHQHKFIVAMHRSKFLFRSSVFDDLKEIWGKCCHGFANQKEKRASYAATGDYGQERIKKDHDFMIWIGETFNKLPDLFGDELKLGRKS